MDISKIKKFFRKAEIPSFRIRQIREAFYVKSLSEWEKISSLPKDLRASLSPIFPILSFSAEKVLKSQLDGSAKALIKFRDSNYAETVLLRLRPDLFAACLSVQIGCAANCPFCATGKLPLERNLSAEEISDQVLFWKQYIKKQNLRGELKNIVFMGMGEPFFNYEAVKKSVNIFKDPDFFNIGQRHISVSTFGYTPKITRFARDFPQVNLAVSLHSVNKEIRNRLVPIAAKFSLEKLAKALKTYLEMTKRKVFIEYVMVKGLNDSTNEAEKLAKWLENIAPFGYFTVNLIPCNSVNKRFKASSDGRIKLFQSSLASFKINATIRKSLGRDIRGACGQLAGKRKKRK